MFAKTNNNKHDWNPVKYLNVFASQQNTNTVPILFLNILQKLPFLGTVDMSGFHQKLIIQLVEVLILMNSIMSAIMNYNEFYNELIFRDIVKTLQTCYFENFGNA